MARRLCVGVALCVAAQLVGADVLSIGFQAPLYDAPDCVEGWAHYHMARAAARSVEAQQWWRDATRGAVIRFETLSQTDTFRAWESAEAFAENAVPTCLGFPPALAGRGPNGNNTCVVLRAGIVGPSSAEAATLVQLVTRQAGLPQLVYSASATSLTPNAYRPLPTSWWDASGPRWPFFRHGYADEMAVGALVSFVSLMQWRMITIVHVRNAYGDASAVATQEVIERTQSGENAIFVQSVLSFSSGDEAGMDKVLDAIAEDVSRVLVLYAFSDDAAVFLDRAYRKQMVGKGWTWLGMEWVRDFTWIIAQQRAIAANMTRTNATATAAVTSRARVLSEGGGAGTSVSHANLAGSWLFGSSKARPVLSAEDTIKTAMQGVVGVVPFRPPPDSVLGGALDRFLRENTVDLWRWMLNVTGAFPIAERPSFDQCPGMMLRPVTFPGIPVDMASPYVFDAVYAIASAAVDAIIAAEAQPNVTARGLAAITAFDIARALYNGTQRESPLTGLKPSYLRTGDRYGMPMSLVNVRDGRIFNVGTWVPAIAPAVNTTDGAILAADSALFSGRWTVTASIQWSSGSTSPPPDRMMATSRAEAAALAAGLFGMVVALLVGAVLHHAHVTILPESGATVLVGAACGLGLRFMFGERAREVAGFNPEVFMLVLLPIIIFESGYAINKRTFFTQFFSINAYAVLGTIISTVVIGIIVYTAGQQGAVLPLTFEEAMSFASLLSATDPVATLSVFSSLKVHPVLNALVYGEAVLNDAVAIVLYRTFTGFLVSDVTATATVWAVLSFVGTLVLSLILGFLGGIFATIAFRYVNVTGQARTVKWERKFLSRLDQLRKFVPKLKVKAVSSAPVMASDAQTAMASQDAAEDDAFDSLDIVSGVSETAVLLLFAYLSFSFAEAVALSGIVSSLFCGISMNHYTRRVLTRDGKLTSSAVFRMLAWLAETAVFFQIGLNVILNLGVGEYKAPLITVTVISCLIARGANIFIVTAIVNPKREDKIPWQFQWQMWHAGLRGAIAFATALAFPSQNRDTIVNATSWLCLFTIFALGGTTIPMLDYLRIPYGIEETKEQEVAAAQASANDNDFKGIMAQFDEWLSEKLYGQGFLREIERLNKEAQLRAKEKLAKSLRVEVAPTESAASPSPDATVAILPAKHVDVDHAAVPFVPSASKRDNVFMTALSTHTSPEQQGSVERAQFDEPLLPHAHTGVPLATSDLAPVSEMPHSVLSPILEASPIADGTDVGGGLRATAGSSPLAAAAAESHGHTLTRIPSAHHPHLPTPKSVGRSGADDVWPADVIDDATGAASSPLGLLRTRGPSVHDGPTTPQSARAVTPQGVAHPVASPPHAPGSAVHSRTPAPAPAPGEEEDLWT